jgi:hypothetical protein
MFILTIHGREREDAYSVINEYGENIFYLFEEEDDAVRYSMMLEESGFPEMHIIEVEDELMLETCNVNDYKYTVITSNDIVIPPKY